MSAATPSADVTGAGSPVEAAVVADAPRGRRLTPARLMVCGLVSLAIAATVLLRATVDGPRPAAAPNLAPADPLAITLSARDVSVVSQVYEPGKDSGWHTHPGIHAVSVLSGVLTVYDSQCRAQTFGPGQAYVGGQELHLARNETDSPVEMTVIYLSPSAPTTSSQHFPAPAGCPVGR